MHSDEIAQEDHSHVVSWQEREIKEKELAKSLNGQGLVGPIRSRADFLPQYENFVNKSRKRPRLDTKLIQPFDRIFNFKSDNAQDNNTSNTKIPPQIMLLLNNLLRGQLIRSTTWWSST